MSGILSDRTDELCDHACGYHEPYGFVPEHGCPIHDKPGGFVPLCEISDREALAIADQHDIQTRLKH